MTTDLREAVARAIHEEYLRYRARHPIQSDPSAAAWDELPEELKESNRRQADNIIVKLDRIGCRVHWVTGREVVRLRMTRREIETLAEMEHTRWREERCRAGWRPGRIRNSRRKISPYLTPWGELADEVRELDRELVRRIPDILARAGLEIERAK